MRTQELTGKHAMCTHSTKHMVCDGSCLISNIEAKWPGSVHDSRIFRTSSLSQRFAQGELNGVLLGDRGYACMLYLLTLYHEPATDAERAVNEVGVRKRATGPHQRPVWSPS
eukprot:superscaffoldBa00005148_g19967